MKKILYIVTTAVLTGFLLVKVTYSLFTSDANNTNDTFTAALTFPVNPSNPITPLPSDTPSPSPFLSSPSPAPANIANHVVISQIGAISSYSFVELYNPTNSSISLTGWKLRKTNSSGTESSLDSNLTGSIPAHGYFLWANTVIAGTIHADISNTGILAASNSAALKKSDDSIVDQVAWGKGTSPQYAETNPFSTDPGTGLAIERKAVSTSTATSMAIGGTDEFKGNGYDTDNNSSDFVIAASHPRNSNSPTGSP